MPIPEAGGSIEKAPETFSLITYLWVFGISMLGGAVSFLRKVKKGKTRMWNFMEFIGEIATSSFAGIITFYLCQAGNLSPLMTAALVGISGHMGSRALFRLEAFFMRNFPPADTEGK